MKKIVFSILTIFLATIVLNAAEKTAKDYIKDLNPSMDEKIIIKAADWLGKEKEKDALPKLIKLLDDSREKVRLHSAMALGYIGEEDAAKPLNKVLLSDESANVRYAAILSTMRIGSKTSLEAYKKAKDSESDPYIKDILKKMEEKIKGK